MYMGCCVGSRVIGALPNEVLPVNRPRRVMNMQGRMVDCHDSHYDRDTLQHALAVMAKYIQLENEDLTIITVGGAVNTILLRNRQTTHDVDFLGSNMDRDQHGILMRAAAVAKCHGQLAHGWFNNEVSLGLPAKALQKVIREAIAQDEVVFQMRGLKVIAAPWEFQLCGKMNRHACGDIMRPYDISDAVSYLRRYIQTHDNEPVSVRTIRRWTVSYYKKTNRTIIGQIAQEYKRIYEKDGIVE